MNTQTQDISWEQLLRLYKFDGELSMVSLSQERSPFLMDYDRITFSSSFRRLAKKTQVHPLTRNDHIHNRLTHSLEVSCVGRSLGNKVGFWLREKNILPEKMQPHNIGEIVQAACMAHDIGNPPFGHAGEEAIRDWFNMPGNSSFIEKGKLTEIQISDFKAFDGNAQGFRTVTALEMYKDAGGMRLTFPTLASMVKYPRCAHDALKKNVCKFNFYTSEAQLFDKIFSNLGLKMNDRYIRHPLSYLTEAADDICYRIIDMEDARELKIITLHDIYDVVDPIKEKLDFDKKKLDSNIPDRRKVGYIRGVLIGKLIDDVYKAFIDAYDKIMYGEIYALIDLCEDDTKEYMDRAKNIFTEVIMKDSTKTALEIGSYSLYNRLLDAFIPAAHNKIVKSPLSFKEERALDLMGVNAPADDDRLYIAYLRVLDFICGMTDDYASFVSKQLSGI